MEKEILDKLKNWADPLERILEYDGIPLWIFYRQMFLTNNFPNRFFKYSIKNLKEDYKQNEIRNKKIISNLIRKAIKINEGIKRNIRKNKKKESSKEPKILFYTQADKIKENKIKKIGNLIEETKKSGLNTYILSHEPIEKNSFSRTLAQENMTYEYITKDIIKKAKDFAKILNKRWNLISEEQKNKLLEINNRSLYPFLKNELDFLFSKEFLELIIIYHEAHKKILKEENIHLVCAIGAATFYPKTLFSAAKVLNIPTFILQHGICFGYTETDLLQDTKFAVFGKHSVEELRDDGIPDKNIRITGASIFDDIIPFMNKKKTSEKKIITLLTDGFYIYGLVEEKEYFRYIEKWLKDINKIKNVEITIKTHPEEREHLEKYKTIIKDFKNVNLISTPGKEILYNQINDSDIIVNFGSTVALESMILDKPVITITNFHNSRIVEFDKVIQRIKNSGASINLTKEEDISIPIKKILENKELQERLVKTRKKFVEDSCYKLDGKSSERVAKLIYSMINIPKPE